MKFFNNLKRSVSDPAFYDEVAKSSTGSSLLHLYLLLALVILIPLTFFSLSNVSLPKQAQRFASDISTQAVALYPQSLVVTVKDGTLSTNSAKPVVIDPPAQWQEMTGSGKHLLVLDTNATVEDFPQKNTLILVTKHAIVSRDKENGRYQFFSLEDVKDATVTRDIVEKTSAAAQPLIAKIPMFVGILLVALPFLSFLIAAFLWAWFMIYLLFISLVLLIISWMLKKQRTYGQLYRMAIYGLPLPLLYQLATMVSSAIYAPFVFSLILLAWVGAIIAKSPHRTLKI